MSDLGRFAIHTTRKRLIDLQRKLHGEGKPYRAFDVYNLGRYERQWWQKDRLKGAEEEHRRVVLEFFKAEVLANPPSPLLHGRKAGAFCHVDAIDSVFTRDEARAVAEATAQGGGREVYCLAWEFEMELRQHCLALDADLGVQMKLVPIPREIMEKNRTSPPPFLEMAVLEAEPITRQKAVGGRKEVEVDVKLTKFLPSLSEVPSKELEALRERAVKSGFDELAKKLILESLAPRMPSNMHEQKEWFEPYLGGIDRRMAGHYGQMARNLKKTLVYKNGVSPLGLLRSCLDYALNDDNEVTGVFEVIKSEFRFSGGPQCSASSSRSTNSETRELLKKRP